MNERKVGLGAAALLILVAGAIDLFQFLITLIPFVGWLITPIISICAAIIFGFWFSYLGIPMLDPKRVLGTLGTMLGEMVPIINAFPMWTARVTYTIINERTP